jgi:hypothetical protein
VLLPVHELIEARVEGRFASITCRHLLLDKMPHILIDVGMALCLWILEGDGKVYSQVMETVGLQALYPAVRVDCSVCVNSLLNIAQ